MMVVIHNNFVFQGSMAAEASKLLKGVDTVALHLAKTALTRDATVSEAPNVGKSRTDLGSLWLLLD